MRIAAVAVTALLVACGDGGPAAPSTSDEPRTRGHELAAELGCEQVTDAGPMFEHARWPFDESLDCWLDGRPSVRIHTFDAALAEGTAASFEQRYGPGAGNPCPDGGDASNQLVVVGPDWAAVATSGELRDRVLDRLGGAYLDGDDTTPVSYPAVDPCPGSPVSTIG